jgi:hypothetical protein
MQALTFLRRDVHGSFHRARARSARMAGIPASLHGPWLHPTAASSRTHVHRSRSRAGRTHPESCACARNASSARHAEGVDRLPESSGMDGASHEQGVPWYAHESGRPLLAHGTRMDTRSTVSAAVLDRETTEVEVGRPCSARSCQWAVGGDVQRVKAHVACRTACQKG